MKKCSHCKTEKDVGAFGKNQAMKDGLMGICRECKALSDEQYRKKYPTRRKQQYKNNKEQELARNKQHYEEHRDKELVRMKRYREENEFYFKQYRENHKEERAAYNEQYRKEHREEVNEKAKRWRKKYPDECRVQRQNRRAIKKNSQGTHTPQEWGQLKERYDYACLCCGRKEPEIKLTEDHVIPLINGGTNFISNIQPLCKSCNCSKGTKDIDYRK